MMPFSVVPHNNLAMRLMLFPAAFFGYLKIIFWRLVCMLNIWITQGPFMTCGFIFGVVLLLAFIAAIIFFRRRDKLVAFSFVLVCGGDRAVLRYLPLPFYRLITICIFR